jgi:hypothetical protein
LSAAKPIKYRPVMQMGFGALNPSYDVWPGPLRAPAENSAGGLEMGLFENKIAIFAKAA